MLKLENLCGVNESNIVGWRKRNPHPNSKNHPFTLTAVYVGLNHKIRKTSFT